MTWWLQKVRADRRQMRLIPVGILLLFQAALLAWQARGDGPTWDEVGHFAAGLDHLRNGRFDMYRVNPPLVRMIALIPVAVRHPEIDPSSYFADFRAGHRPEFRVGRSIAITLAGEYCSQLTIARLACLPFALLGSWICFRWASELWGWHGGVVSLLLWVISPSVLAYGHLITPDVGATSVGIAAAYCFRRWIRIGGFGCAFASGMVLGVAELTKLTWVIAFAMWPLGWISFRIGRRSSCTRMRWMKEGAAVAAIMTVALMVLNAGYGFEGSFQRLSTYRFASQLLGGAKRQGVYGAAPVGNRFIGCIFGVWRVPVPHNYLMGVDGLESEYEHKYWSFLNREWRLGGWWYYYLYAMLVKEPLGTWALGVMAASLAIWRPKAYGAEMISEELILIGPAVAVLCMVSMKTGFNHHLRYVLPAFPFLFISFGRVGRAFAHVSDRAIAGLVCAALIWSAVSSLSTVPHSLSYFNSVAGGPMDGHFHLGNSNSDWGQDLLYLKEWADRHPTARPLRVAYDVPLIDPTLAGIECGTVPPGPHSTNAGTTSPAEIGPLPGWYAVSVNKIHDRKRAFDYFLRFTPVGYAGYSMYIYHITVNEANRIRGELGLAPLPIGPTTGPSGDDGISP